MRGSREQDKMDRNARVILNGVVLSVMDHAHCSGVPLGLTLLRLMYHEFQGVHVISSG